MIPTPALSDIAHTIQSAVAPAFLLAAIGGFLNVLASRISRVVDRARGLERELTPIDHPDHARQVWEFRLLDRRITVVNRSILLCTASALLICLVVAGMFIGVLADLAVGRWLAVAFILAMAMLIAGLCFFLYEIRLAIAGIRVREELLEREENARRR